MFDSVDGVRPVEGRAIRERRAENVLDGWTLSWDDVGGCGSEFKEHSYTVWSIQTMMDTLIIVIAQRVKVGQDSSRVRKRGRSGSAR